MHVSSKTSILGAMFGVEPVPPKLNSFSFGHVELGAITSSQEHIIVH